MIPVCSLHRLSLGQTTHLSAKHVAALVDYEQGELQYQQISSLHFPHSEEYDLLKYDKSQVKPVKRYDCRGSVP